MKADVSKGRAATGAWFKCGCFEKVREGYTLEEVARGEAQDGLYILERRDAGEQAHGAIVALYKRDCCAALRQAFEKRCGQGTGKPTSMRYPAAAVAQAMFDR